MELAVPSPSYLHSYVGVGSDVMGGIAALSQGGGTTFDPAGGTKIFCQEGDRGGNMDKIHIKFQRRVKILNVAGKY